MKPSRIVWLGGVIAIAACSDDTTAPTGDRLSREEALFIASQIVASGDQSTLSAQQNAQTSARVDPRTITQDLKLSAPCPRGGQVHLDFDVDLSFDAAVGSLELDLAGSLQHDACAFERAGVIFTLDGNPDIDFDAHAEARNHQPAGEHTFEVNGAFRWSTSDGRSGTCAIAIDAVTKFTDRTRTIEGEVCGHTFSETVSWR